jgi:hypothetical protein
MFIVVVHLGSGFRSSYPTGSSGAVPLSAIRLRGAATKCFAAQKIMPRAVYWTVKPGIAVMRNAERIPATA